MCSLLAGENGPSAEELAERFEVRRTASAKAVRHTSERPASAAGPVPPATRGRSRDARDGDRDR